MTEYPDPTTGAASTAQEETTTVNALGQTLTSTDRNGNVHPYSYDVLGRVLFDSITTLGTGVDGTVRLIEYGYDGQGNAARVTSYSGPSGGTIVNDVYLTYNGLGQLTGDYQSHSGGANPSWTPAVLYTYSEMSGGADNSRLVTMTYPDGYVLTLNYSSGLNDTISRLSSLSDSTGTLEAYKYLGLDTVVERDHPLSGVNETYISQTGATGDAGDQYVGLDRFGRVDDVLWLNAATGATTDEFQEGFDPDNNVLFQNNTVDPALSELDTYTGENELATYLQGTLNSTHTALTGTASASQSYVTNGVGDFTSITTNGTTQTQTANAQNEVTGVGGATTPTYDANGNMTTDQNGNQLVYDAWDRLVAVLNSSGTTLETMSYDGLNRLITQTIGGTTTDRYYSSQDQLLEEEVGGAATARYVWSPVYVNAMILRDAATGTAGTLNQRLWVQQDANWNVTALVNGSGVVVERYVYSPFGTVTIYNASYSSTLTSSAYNWVYGFQGMRFDALSGLNESQSRWYSPALQRWTTVDPSGFSAGDADLYRFVGNDPANATDPSGLSRLSDGWDRLTDAFGGARARVSRFVQQDVAPWLDRTGTRVVGGVQVAGGLLAIGGGAVFAFATAETGVGVLAGIGIMYAGVDLVVHGAHRVWYAEASPSWLNQLTHVTTGSSTAGDIAEFLESLAAPGSGLVKITQARRIFQIERQVQLNRQKLRELDFIRRGAVETENFEAAANLQAQMDVINNQNMALNFERQTIRNGLTGLFR